MEIEFELGAERSIDLLAFPGSRIVWIMPSSQPLSRDWEGALRVELTSPDDVSMIVAHRLIVARAAQRDAMRWWDDQSLAVGAEGLARRLFPRSAPEAMAKLALMAGRSRHEQAVQGEEGALHLYFLGEEVEYRLDQAIGELPLRPPTEPLRDRDALTTALEALGPEPEALPTTNRGHGRIQLPPKVLDLAPVEQARIFAWTYVRIGGVGPRFPFTMPEWESSG